MLSAGLSNSEIAARLVVSARTVDLHVSAILQKMGVRTRAQATVLSARVGAAGAAGARQVDSTTQGPGESDPLQPPRSA